MYIKPIVYTYKCTSWIYLSFIRIKNNTIMVLTRTRAVYVLIILLYITFTTLDLFPYNIRSRKTKLQSFNNNCSLGGLSLNDPRKEIFTSLYFYTLKCKGTDVFINLTLHNGRFIYGSLQIFSVKFGLLYLVYLFFIFQ